MELVLLLFRQRASLGLRPSSQRRHGDIRQLISIQPSRVSHTTLCLRVAAVNVRLLNSRAVNARHPQSILEAPVLAGNHLPDKITSAAVGVFIHTSDVRIRSALNGRVERVLIAGGPVASAGFPCWDCPAW